MGAQLAGGSGHSALAGWWKLPRPARTVASAGRLVRQGWLSDGFRDSAQSAAARERATAMVEAYAAGLDPDREPVGVERTVALKTTHAALFGRVDRIDARGDGLAIVDYKTGRRPLAVDDARTSLALAVYAAGAARVLRRTCRRVELHHLPTGTVLAWDHSDDGLARHVERADALAAEIGALDDEHRAGVDAARADELYPARPGPLCGWCDYLRSCPVGSAVAAPRAPWAGLEEV